MPCATRCVLLVSCGILAIGAFVVDLDAEAREGRERSVRELEQSGVQIAPRASDVRGNRYAGVAALREDDFRLVGQALRRAGIPSHAKCLHHTASLYVRTKDFRRAVPIVRTEVDRHQLRGLVWDWQSCTYQPTGHVGSATEEERGTGFVGRTFLSVLARGGDVVVNGVSSVSVHVSVVKPSATGRASW